MSRTLYIGKDIVASNPTPIFSEEDFVRLIRDRLGTDAENYIRSIIEERDANEMREDLAEQIDDLQWELDEARNELDDLRSAADKLEAIRAIIDT